MEEQTPLQIVIEEETVYQPETRRADPGQNLRQAGGQVAENMRQALHSPAVQATGRGVQRGTVAAVRGTRRGLAVCLRGLSRGLEWLAVRVQAEKEGGVNG